jgi:hypothetical protein
VLGFREKNPGSGFISSTLEQLNILIWGIREMRD